MSLVYNGKKLPSCEQGDVFVDRDSALTTVKTMLADDGTTIKKAFKKPKAVSEFCLEAASEYIKNVYEDVFEVALLSELSRIVYSILTSPCPIGGRAITLRAYNEFLAIVKQEEWLVRPSRLSNVKTNPERAGMYLSAIERYLDAFKELSNGSYGCEAQNALLISNKIKDCIEHIADALGHEVPKLQAKRVFMVGRLNIPHGKKDGVVLKVGPVDFPLGEMCGTFCCFYTKEQDKNLMSEITLLDSRLNYDDFGTVHDLIVHEPLPQANASVGVAYRGTGVRQLYMGKAKHLYNLGICLGNTFYIPPRPFHSASVMQDSNEACLGLRLKYRG